MQKNESVLEPVDRVSEVLFGLIMALAFPFFRQRNLGQRADDADHENTHDPGSNPYEACKGITAN